MQRIVFTSSLIAILSCSDIHNENAFLSQLSERGRSFISTTYLPNMTGYFKEKGINVKYESPVFPTSDLKYDLFQIEKADHFLFLQFGFYHNDSLKKSLESAVINVDQNGNRRMNLYPIVMSFDLNNCSIESIDDYRKNIQYIDALNSESIDFYYNNDGSPIPSNSPVIDSLKRAGIDFSKCVEK